MHKLCNWCRLLRMKCTLSLPCSPKKCRNLWVQLHRPSFSLHSPVITLSAVPHRTCLRVNILLLLKFPWWRFTLCYAVVPPEVRARHFVQSHCKHYHFHCYNSIKQIATRCKYSQNKINNVNKHTTECHYKANRAECETLTGCERLITFSLQLTSINCLLISH